MRSLLQKKSVRVIFARLLNKGVNSISVPDKKLEVVGRTRFDGSY
jgi:hypothetical protein